MPATRLAGPLTGDLESDLAVVILVCAFMLGLRLLDKNLAATGRFGAAMIGMGLLCVAVALFLDTQAALNQNNFTTPIDPARAAAGRLIYAQNCLRCHGATGHGDGPDAPSLPMRPMDLTVHITQHNEIYFYQVITNGRGAMPAFGNQLTNTQMGDVIDYLRVLATLP